MMQMLMTSWMQIKPVFWQLLIVSLLLYVVWILMVSAANSITLSGIQSRRRILDHYIARSEAAKLSGCTFERYEVAEAMIGWYERPKMSKTTRLFWIIFAGVFCWLSLCSMILAASQGLRQLAA